MFGIEKVEISTSWIVVNDSQEKKWGTFFLIVEFKVGFFIILYQFLYFSLLTADPPPIWVLGMDWADWAETALKQNLVSFWISKRK